MSEIGFVQCVLCGHGFYPNLEAGFLYCPACGRRFDPHSALEETVIMTAAPEGKGEGEESVSSLPPPESPSASRRFGEYDIIEEIARGGMGVVYLARQRVLRRVVALKVLRSGDNASQEERERLLREAKAAAGLSHPNIVPIHEFSIHQGQPYFTMDFIDGQPLDRRLEDGPLNVREAVSIIETVARAIAFAHTRGIIHRDLKPANIIIDAQGRPMVTDFGLAVELAPEGEVQERMTSAGAVMGTIPYSPPEQAAGKIDQITERSDVYSMGAVLYEMVTGRPPFSGFTQFELMRRVINQEPAPPRQFNPKVHRDVETIILKCLEKEQKRRYASAKAFADDCQSFLKGEVIAARPVTLGYRCRRFLTRRPLLTFLSACVVVLSLAVWIGLDHFRVLAKEKKATERALEDSMALAERIAREKEEAARQVRRDWRTEYNINFDYAFRWEGDMERSRRLEIPWMNRELASLLADPPRLAIAAKRGDEDNSSSPMIGGTDLGFPFVFPRDARVTLRLQTPEADVGELFLFMDVDRSYKPHPGTTAIRFGSPGRPGASIYRSETVIGENPAFSLRPGISSELVVERADDRILAYQDGRLILSVDDPPPVFTADAGRLTLDVRGGALEFFDLSVELRGLSRSLTASLIETANTMAAQGRADLALRLYINVLLEPTDPQNRLRALRGYARSLWLGLPRGERGQAGIEKACLELNGQLAAAGRVSPGEIDYLIGLALAFNPVSQREGRLALEHLDRAAAIAYSAGGDASGEYGDLARLESLFVYLRLGMVGEAARRFNIMFEDGVITRLYDRFGAELGGGGQAALLLEKAEQLIADKTDLETASVFLRAAAAIAPSSRETAIRFLRLGRAHLAVRETAKAVECMHWAERLSPDWFQPYLEEALIHFGVSDVGLAENALERAGATLPQSQELHLGMAKLYLDDAPEAYRDPVKAEAAARTASTLSQGRNPAALELLAVALLRQERLREALERIDAALALERNDARLGIRDRIVAGLPREGGAQ